MTQEEEKIVGDLRLVGNTIQMQWGKHPHVEICHSAADYIEAQAKARAKQTTTTQTRTRKGK